MPSYHVDYLSVILHVICSSILNNKQNYQQGASLSDKHGGRNIAINFNLIYYFVSQFRK